MTPFRPSKASQMLVVLDPERPSNRIVLWVVRTLIILPQVFKVGMSVNQDPLEDSQVGTLRLRSGM